jgi:hypothetical protein
LALQLNDCSALSPISLPLLQLLDFLEGSLEECVVVSLEDPLHFGHDVGHVLLPAPTDDGAHNEVLLLLDLLAFLVHPCLHHIEFALQAAYLVLEVLGAYIRLYLEVVLLRFELLVEDVYIVLVLLDLALQIVDVRLQLEHIVDLQGQLLLHSCVLLQLYPE